MNLGIAPLRPTRVQETDAKGLAILSVACAMAKAKCVDADPATNARAATPQ
jgi:hypothetical protein